MEPQRMLVGAPRGPADSMVRGAAAVMGPHLDVCVCVCGGGGGVARIGTEKGSEVDSRCVCGGCRYQPKLTEPDAND